MQSTTRFLVLIFVAISVVAAQNYPKSTPKVVRKTFELYSWQEPNGDWEFSLLYNLERYYSAKEVLDNSIAIMGVGQLKLRLSQLPTGATVLWLDRLPPHKESQGKISERFGYPPPDVIEEIRKYATKHKIKIEVFDGKSDATEPGGPR